MKDDPPPPEMAERARAVLAAAYRERGFLSLAGNAETGQHVIALTAMLTFATREVERERERADALQQQLEAIMAETWCYAWGDDVTHDFPVEWAEENICHDEAPFIQEFGWAGRLPNTWVVFNWSGDEDDGKWVTTEYPTEAEANAAIAARLP